MSVAIVGVIPLFSILWTEAVETPARRASSASDHPRSARAAASLAPSAETVRSMSGSVRGVTLEVSDSVFKTCRIGDVSDSTRFFKLCNKLETIGFQGDLEAST